MANNASGTDAQLILQLYDLRREAEMRKARAWWAGSFWPNSSDEILAVTSSFGSQENAWFRQVSGYWEMVASIVLHGALNEDLFFDSSGEMWFILAKVHPYLKEYREKAQTPETLQQVEKLALRTSQGQHRLQRLIKRVDGWKKARKEAAKAG